MSTATSSNSFSGTDLKSLRKYFGFTQAEVASAVGTSRGRIANVENGISTPGTSLRTRLSVFTKTLAIFG
jgi:transcriptional regulator with XRE-family HTH domain